MCTFLTYPNLHPPSPIFTWVVLTRTSTLHLPQPVHEDTYDHQVVSSSLSSFVIYLDKTSLHCSCYRWGSLQSGDNSRRSPQLPMTCDQCWATHHSKGFPLSGPLRAGLDLSIDRPPGQCMLLAEPWDLCLQCPVIWCIMNSILCRGTMK